MNRKWVCGEIDLSKVNEIKEKYNLTDLVANILVKRNIIEQNEIRTFLEPTRNDFYDPFLLQDMQVAVDRIIKAIEENEKIIIYGDYDVDGITSICILKQFLESRG